MTLPQLSNIDSQLVLRDSYDIKYRIYNHLSNDKSRPLASVALHEQEENTKTSSLYEAIEVYKDLNILGLFGLSIKEYLSLPSDFCNALLESAKKTAISNDATIGNIENQLGKK
jgi:hypothetical protein